MKPEYFTICSKNYLAYALTLGRSLTQVDPKARFTIYLADTPLSANQAEQIEFEVIEAARLDLPSFSAMTMRYTIMEFNTAIKAAAFEHMFTVRKAGAAIYLDPDILVLQPLRHVEAALAEGAQAVLTPHATEPLDDGAEPDDLRILRTGVYNLGFAAFSKTPETERFIRWWRERLSADCRVALDEGIFVDQRWMDLAPAYVRGLHILSHPGYNAAYWNLSHRPVARTESGWTAAGETLHFFHFSGVVPGDPSIFSKHQNRFGVEDIGPLKALLEDYLERIERNGHALWRRQPYGFALPAPFDALETLVRGLVRRVYPGPAEAVLFDGERLESLCNAMAVETPPDANAPITNLAYELWRRRTDLRESFDLQSPQGRRAFRAWIITSGVREYRLDARFLEPLRLDLTDERGGARIGLRPLLVWAVQRRSLARPLLRLLPNRVVESAKRRVQRALADPGGAPGAPAPAGGPQRALSVYGASRRDGASVLRADLKSEVAVYGYFRAETGLGEAARREFRALRAAGAPVHARLIRAATVFQDQEDFEFPLLEGPSAARIHLIHVNADQTACAADWAQADIFDPAHYRIGYWAWELERFPNAWADAFDRVDEIWTPSRFTAEAVKAAAGDKPVHVMPHCAAVTPPATEAAKTAARRRFALPDDRIFFLCMFDLNSYSARKNPLGALEAFAAAKPSAPELALVLKFHGGRAHDAARAEILKAAGRLDDVRIIDQVLSQDEVNQLYQACDGLISLHRSEGFGLTIAEAMGRSLPVIATHYSGVTDFFDDSAGAAIPYTLVPVASGAYPYGEGARWAEPDIAAAAEALAALARDPELRAERGLAGQARVRAQLSSSRVGRLMADRLRALMPETDIAA